MKKRQPLNIILFIVLFTYVGCSSTEKKQIDKIVVNEMQTQRDVENRLEVINGKYILAPPDVIEITIDDNPELQTTATIRPDGNIFFPLLGDVYADGLTPLQLRGKIHEMLGKYLRDIPEEAVSISVIGFNSKRVYVHSFGSGIQEIPFTGNLTVLDAIGRSGLLSRLSNQRKIRIVRGERDPEKNPKKLILNLNEITKHGHAEKNIILKPNDIVYIPAKFSTRIGFAVQSLLFPMQPIESVGRTAAGAQYGFGINQGERGGGSSR